MFKIFLIALNIAAAFAVAAAPALAGHWKLDDGAGTVIKSSVPGVPDGKVLNAENTQWVEGRKGNKALYFKGDPDKKRKGGTVRLATKKIFNSSKPFSITCWIKPESRQVMKREAAYELISNTLGDHGPGLRLRFQWNQAAVYSGTGKRGETRGVSAKASTYPVNRSVWSHLAVTYDTKTLKLYVNGALAGSKECTVTPGRDFFFIASYNGGFAYSFMGAVSDVKFFAQALTPVQVMTEAKELELD